MPATPESSSNGRLAQKISDSPLLTAVARLMLVAVLPISIAVGGWMAQRLVHAVDILTETVINIRIDVAGLKKDVEYMREQR
jgi:hypothetical protein